MESSCNNDNIGYCQNQCSILMVEGKKYGYKKSKVSEKVEVDCSETVRKCVLYAEVNIETFGRTNAKSALKNTRTFECLEEHK